MEKLDQALKEKWSEVQGLTREPIQIVVSSDGPKKVWEPAEGTTTTDRIQGMRTTIRELSHIVYMNNLDEKRADRLQRVEGERDRAVELLRKARGPVNREVKVIKAINYSSDLADEITNLIDDIDTLLADLESTD